MTVQIPLGFHNGLDDARAFHAEQEKAADGLQHIDHITNVEHGQSEFFLAPSLIRQQARILREHRLSLYADRWQIDSPDVGRGLAPLTGGGTRPRPMLPPAP